jgi:hypothetical protein
MAMKADWAAFVQSLKTEIAVIRRDHLEPLESGRLKIHQGGTDITNAEAASLQKNIASITLLWGDFSIKHPLRQFWGASP